MIEGLDLARRRGDEKRLGAGLLDRLARLGQLDLLDALLGYEKCDPLALQLCSHG